MDSSPHPSSSSVWHRISFVITLPFLGLIKLYQWGISPLLPSTCIHKPSCSYYGLTALRRFGPVLGVLLIGLRILRCHPWAERFYDPVPKRLGWGYFKRNPLTGRFYRGACMPLPDGKRGHHER